MKNLNIGEEIVLLGVLNLFCSDCLEEWKNDKGFDKSKRHGQALSLLSEMADELENIVYNITVDATEFHDLSQDIEPFMKNHKLNYSARLSMFLKAYEYLLTNASMEFRKAYSRQTMPLIKLCIEASEKNSFAMHTKGRMYYKSFIAKCCEEIKKMGVQFAELETQEK